MKHNVLTLVLIFVALTLTGCNEPQQKDDLLTGITLGDIAPVKEDTAKKPGQIKTFHLNILVIDTPPVDSNFLESFWELADSRTISFKDPQAFTKNSFAANYAQFESWDKITGVLRDIGGKKTESISLFLQDGQPEKFVISKLKKKETVFYLPPQGIIESVPLGPGELGLKVLAASIPNQRGVCTVNIVPAFFRLRRSPIPELAAREKLARFSFESLEFQLQMSPGDFFVLGPKEAISDHITIAGKLFAKKTFIKTNRFYIFLCMAVDD